MSDAIELDFTLDPASAFEGMVAGGRRVFSGRGRLLLMGILLMQAVITPLGFIAAYILMMLAINGELANGLVGFVLAGMIGGAFGIWINHAIYKRMARMVCQSRFGQGGRIRLESSGVRLSSAHSTWQTGWYDVEDLLLGKRSLSVAISGIVLIIPLSAFKDAAEMSAVHMQALGWFSAQRSFE